MYYAEFWQILHFGNNNFFRSASGFNKNTQEITQYCSKALHPTTCGTKPLYLANSNNISLKEKSNLTALQQRELPKTPSCTLKAGHLHVQVCLHVHAKYYTWDEDWRCPMFTKWRVMSDGSSEGSSTKANSFLILFAHNIVKNESGKRLKSGSQRDFVIQRKKTSGMYDAAIHLPIAFFP